MFESIGIFRPTENHTVIRYESYCVAQQNVKHNMCCHCNIMLEDMKNEGHQKRQSQWKLIINDDVWGFLAYPRHLELLLAVRRNLIKHRQISYIFQTDQDKRHKIHLCCDLVLFGHQE